MSFPPSNTNGGGSNEPFTGLTDGQLRASPIATAPAMTAGGNIKVSVTTTATALPSNACKQATVSNPSDTDITVTQSGNEFVVMSRSYFTFLGLKNTNNLSLIASEPVEAYVRWES